MEALEPRQVGGEQCQIRDQRPVDQPLRLSYWPPIHLNSVALMAQHVTDENSRVYSRFYRQTSRSGRFARPQAEKIRAMAVVHGGELIDIIVEGGESAKSLNRPGMSRLLALVDSGGAQAVIVAKLDRLTRSVKDLCTLLELCFSQTPMRLIDWELPLILRFRLGPVLRAVIAFAIASFRSRAALQFEILALRHQIGVLQRSVKRPKLTPADRVLWAWLCCIWKGWQCGAFIMKAATVVGWHRKGFGLFWSWKIRRGKLGRPAVPTEVRELIRMLSRENPLWGTSHSWRTAEAWHPCR